MLLEVQPPCVTVAPAVRAQVGNPPLRLFFPPVTPAFPQVTGLPRGGQGRDRTAEPSGFQPDALPTELAAHGESAPMVPSPSPCCQRVLPCERTSGRYPGGSSLLAAAPRSALACSAATSL